MSTIQSALQEAKKLLSQSDSDSPQLDVELLLAFVLGKSREHLFTWPEKELQPEQQQAYQLFCKRRLKGHPIAYLLGQAEFWSLTLQVNSSVLIPRPETELLVELCLDKFDTSPHVIADLGTGSGAIALALAKERRQWQILACDLSDDALQVARSNQQNLKLENIQFHQGQWCEAFEEIELDAIISNPPYIDSCDEHLSQGDVRFEPEMALVSDNNGLADIEIISKQACNKLKHKGWLFLEHGFQQADAVQQILRDNNYQQIATHKDLAGHDRITCGLIEK